MPKKQPNPPAAEAPLAVLSVPNPGDTATTTAAAVLLRAEQLVITNDEEYQAAVSGLQYLKGKFRDIDGKRAELKKPILEAARSVEDFFRNPLASLTRAETILKRKILAYQQEQERKRREEQARLDEQARKEQAKLAAQAQRAADAGKIEKAEVLQQRATTVVAPTVMRAAPKVQGLSTRKTYSIEVTDIKALCKAVAEGRAPASFVEANLQVLNAQARSLKSEFVCDGIKVIESDSLAASAA